jgi:hypothetical protein
MSAIMRNMSNREQAAVILQLFGLGHVEQRLFRIFAGLAENRQRFRIWFAAALVPVTIWAAFAVYVAAALMWTGRRRAAGGVDHPQPLSDVGLAEPLAGEGGTQQPLSDVGLPPPATEPVGPRQPLADVKPAAPAAAAP